MTKNASYQACDKDGKCTSVRTVELEKPEKEKLRSEICSLNMMMDLRRSVRRDFLEVRRKFKALREEHSTHKLAELHYENQLKTLEKHMLLCAKNYQALREDINIQRVCIETQYQKRI